MQEETVRRQLESEERSAAAAKEESSAPPKISRGIDGELNSIVDLAVRDYVLYWLECHVELLIINQWHIYYLLKLQHRFGHLMTSEDDLRRMLRRDLWAAVTEITERISK